MTRKKLESHSSWPTSAERREIIKNFERIDFIPLLIELKKFNLIMAFSLTRKIAPVRNTL